MLKGFYYNSIKEQRFLLKPQYLLSIKENVDTSYVPRFTIKNPEIFKDFPTNTPLKPDINLFLKAIQYGMILQIDYKGEEDDNFSGHERNIYPMILGKSEDGKILIRGYHLNGWSVSKGTNIEKEWRLFRFDRILNVVFTGAFFRLAPDGYVMRDKQMKTITALADFNQIRNFQQKLINANSIDAQDRVVINKINNIEVKDLNYNLKLIDPWANNVIPKKDAKSIRITFAKPLIGSGSYIAILGTSIEPNVTFKLKKDNTVLGAYKSIKWIMGDELEKLQTLDQRSEFKLYMFLKGY